MSIKRAIIDFSAFVNGNKCVVIKELTIVDIDSLSSQHWIFRPPKHDTAISWNGTNSNSYRHNQWLSAHYHGLEFYEGFTNYETFPFALESICAEVSLLFAPDQEKASILEELFNRRRLVFSLETLGCPSLPKQSILPRGEDVDDVCGERNNDKKVARKCLFHHMHSPDFFCTQYNALWLAVWAAKHPDALDMNRQENREKTFTNWTVKTSPKDLAAAGFVRVYTSPDTVRCVYCGLSLLSWKEEDVPLADHEFNAPRCQFVRYIAQQKEHSTGGGTITKEDMKKKKKKDKKDASKDDHSETIGYGCNGDYWEEVTESNLFESCRA